MILVFSYLQPRLRRRENGSDGAEGEADEAGEDAKHAEDFAADIGFVQENEAVGKAYHRAATTNGTHNSYHGSRIAESKHIDVVTYYQKHGDHRNDSDVFDRFES